MLSKGRFSAAILAGVMAAVLSGCSNGNQPRPAKLQVNTKPTDLRGEWVQVGGPLLAKFTGSEFESINTQTNDVVAAGAYKFNSESDIQLEWVGAISQGKQTATCALSTPQLLSCKPSNGSGFQLQRVST
ncbi:MAG: hypothetical protein AAF468_07635 [Pseudomonadota bacterium]